MIKNSSISLLPLPPLLTKSKIVEVTMMRLNFNTKRSKLPKFNQNLPSSMLLQKALPLLQTRLQTSISLVLLFVPVLHWGT
jgi:hypothetical protein